MLVKILQGLILLNGAEISPLFLEMELDFIPHILPSLEAVKVTWVGDWV